MLGMQPDVEFAKHDECANNNDLIFVRHAMKHVNVPITSYGRLTSRIDYTSHSKFTLVLKMILINKEISLNNVQKAHNVFKRHLFYHTLVELLTTSKTPKRYHTPVYECVVYLCIITGNMDRC